LCKEKTTGPVIVINGGGKHTERLEELSECLFDRIISDLENNYSGKERKKQ